MCETHKIPFLAKFARLDFSPADAVATSAVPVTPERQFIEPAIRFTSLKAPIQRAAQYFQDPLVVAQNSILEKYGTLKAGINPLGFLRKSEHMSPYVPAHLFDVIDGMGFTLAKVSAGDEKKLDDPDLLFYVPKDPHHAKGPAGTFTDMTPDGEYVLIGWGWYSDYVPGETPVLPGVSPSDWFIHESGYHTADGGFVATPPVESYPGEKSAPAPTGHPAGVAAVGSHPRVWDLHMWRTDLTTGQNSLPVISMLAPESLKPLFPADTLKIGGNAFFYPETRESVVAEE